MSGIYTPELSDQELQRSYWLVTHYKKIQHVFKGVLIVWSAIAFLFIIWQTLSFTVFERDHNNALVEASQGLLSQKDIFPGIREAVIESVGSRSSMEGFENGYALLSNPNTGWYFQAELAFMRGDAIVRSVPVALSSGEKRYFIGLGIPPGAPAISVSLRNVRWHFISDAEQVLIAQLADIKVEDISFISSDKSGISKLTPVSKVRFTVNNASISSYWDIAIPVVAKDNGTIVAVGQATLNVLDSGEKKSAEAVWFVPVITADQFDIKPFIDIVDPSALKSRTRD